MLVLCLLEKSATHFTGTDATVLVFTFHNVTMQKSQKLIAVSVKMH